MIRATFIVEMDSWHGSYAALEERDRFKARRFGKSM